MKRLVQILLFILLLSWFILYTGHKVWDSIDEWETKCHGQCATGNSQERHDCKKHCEEQGVCPFAGDQ